MNVAISPPKEKWTKLPIRQEDGEVFFSSNDLIDAYLHGKKRQADLDKMILIEKLGTNLNRAKRIAEEMYDFILQEGFRCTGVKMKIKDISRYILMFLIDENDMCDNRFDIIYDKSISKKIEHNSLETFDISIVFVQHTASFSMDAALSDGFILTYNV
jgi:hypothetical protein